jgi:hypothetical protein
MQIIILILLTYAYSFSIANAQNYIGIDHIPIVVKNLDSIKKIMSQKLHFTIKEGKIHEGIKNFFIKFKNGSYLEFIAPIDTLHSIGKEYYKYLEKRQGANTMTISILNSDIVVNNLHKLHMPYHLDSYKIWRTVEPANADVFYIEYSNRSWQEKKEFTTHQNNSISLNATFIKSKSLKQDISKYKNIGFKEIGNTTILGTTCKKLQIGKSILYLFDSKEINATTSKFSYQYFSGICGVEIKTSTLNTIRKNLAGNPNAIIENDKIVFFLKDINFLIIFTE